MGLHQGRALAGWLLLGIYYIYSHLSGEEAPSPGFVANDVVGDVYL
jgi:hypothetical protein